MHRRLRLAIVTALVLTVTVVAAPAFGAGVSNDPAASQQWALSKIKAPAAWTKTTGQGVLVGVVDTGVDLSHEDLSGQVAESANCIGSNGDQSKCKAGGTNAQDYEGHG